MVLFPNTTRKITNALTGQMYQFCSVEHISPTEEHILEVVAVCNEPEIYSWLFSENLKGSPYPFQLASQWFTWANDGWKNNSHFIFALLAPDGKIIASLGIKNADLECGEIGYWCSENHRGIMTNAVTALIDAARLAGFQSFCAQARKNNIRSEKLLARIGFQPSSETAELAEHLVYKLG